MPPTIEGVCLHAFGKDLQVFAVNQDVCLYYNTYRIAALIVLRHVGFVSCHIFIIFETKHIFYLDIIHSYPVLSAVLILFSHTS